MGQGKAGWWIAGLAAAVVFISIGYGMGRRAGTAASSASLDFAGASAPAISVEPIQPQAELAAITVSPSAPAENPAVQPAAAEASAPLPLEESARNRNIQLALKAAGFDPGSADGRMGPRTQTAVRDFQRAQGLTPDGKVGPKTWSKLESFLNKAGD
jgi:peptidoglycan hydrolase-like protein with peptidoglycan-binding domain